jgi:hypothetical protein
MGVVAHLMAILNYLLIEVGVLADIVTNHEKGRFNVVVAKCLKDKGGGLGYGTVVESQVNDFLVTIHTPKCLWVEPA